MEQKRPVKYPKNKYRKGWTLFSMSEVAAKIRAGEWLYIDHKVYHPGFLSSMTFRTIDRYVEEHRISEAINARDEYFKGEYRRPLPEE